MPFFPCALYERKPILGIAVVCILAALFPFVAQGSSAALQNSSNDSLVIVLGSDTGMAGGAVLASMSLRIPDGMQVGSVEADIAIPSALVKLKGVRPSLAIGVSGGEVTSETSSSDDSKLTLIHISVKSKKPLPSAGLATLDLRIADKVENAEKIELKIQKISALTVDGKAIPDASSKDGEIKISKSAPGFVNCFFFSH